MFFEMLSKKSLVDWDFLYRLFWRHQVWILSWFLFLKNRLKILLFLSFDRYLFLFFKYLQWIWMIVIDFQIENLNLWPAFVIGHNFSLFGLYLKSWGHCPYFKQRLHFLLNLIIIFINFLSQMINLKSIFIFQKFNTSLPSILYFKIWCFYYLRSNWLLLLLFLWVFQSFKNLCNLIFKIHLFFLRVLSY